MYNKIIRGGKYEENFNIFFIGVKNILPIESDHCGELASAFSRGLLLGARGNSGVILSQIFRGFGESVKEKQELVLVDVAEAFISGTKRAYKVK